MLFGIRLSATLAACLIGIACFGAGAARAAPQPEIVMVSDNNTEETESPAMQKGIAAIRKRDFAAALPYFRQAAKQGNASAEVVLAHMYFEGMGVAKNTGRALIVLKNVIEKNREPSRTRAEEALHEIAEKLRYSTDPADKELAMVAALLPLAANPYVEQWSRNYAYNMAHSRIVFCGALGCW